MNNVGSGYSSEVFTDIQFCVKRAKKGFYLGNEVEILELINEYGMRPLIFSGNDSMILMEYVKGDVLLEWVKKEDDTEIIKSVLVKILETAKKLDELKVNWGESYYINKNIIIDENNDPVFIDWGDAKGDKKPQNFRLVCHNLFIMPGFNTILRSKVDLPKFTDIYPLIESYSKDKNKGFNNIINILK